MTHLKCYFSFRSPFAAITIVRLRRLQALADVDIELMPLWPAVMFGGHMDNPTDNLFKMAYIFNDAARQAEVAGLNRTFFDSLAGHFKLTPGTDYSQQKLGIPMGEERWDKAHKAFLYAMNEGKGWDFADKVCIRRFDFDGKGSDDVMSDDTIFAIAEACGLDGGAALAAIDDANIEQQVSDIVRKGEDAGVFGVPFFVLEQDGVTESFWGNDRLEYVIKYIHGLDTLPGIPPVTLDECCR